MRAVRRIAIRHTLHVRIGLQQGADTGNLLGTNALEHHMHIRSGHLGGRTELGSNDLQAPLHLRVIRQVFRHVGIDIHMEHQDAGYDRQRYRNGE